MSNRKLLVALGWAALSALPATPTWAATCGLDESPAATLLLPYFEVDLASPTGRTTLLSINNSTDAAVLTHVTLWSDLGVPTLDFNVYLTGYDVQTLNLRDLFNGKLPRTASDGQDPTDAISPQGILSQDLNFASCQDVLPHPETLGQNFIDHLRAAHTGRHSNLLRGCAGQVHGDNLARGYVTVDTVSRCAFTLPSEPGYFGAGGIATNQNVLWGDYYLIDQNNNFAMGDNLVRLEADPAAFGAGSVTFYGRYVNNSGVDAREPLANVWAARYIDGGPFTGGTEMVVWRDSGVKNAAFPCTGRPAWYPLDLGELAAFDEEETAELYTGDIIGTPVPGPRNPYLPAESNRVKVGPEFPVPFPFGWLHLDFGMESTGRFPAQSYVTTLMSAEGRFMVGFGATPLIGLCERNNPQFPPVGGF